MFTPFSVTSVVDLSTSHRFGCEHHCSANIDWHSHPHPCPSCWTPWGSESNLSCSVVKKRANVLGFDCGRMVYYHLMFRFTVKHWEWMNHLACCNTAAVIQAACEVGVPGTLGGVHMKRAKQKCKSPCTDHYRGLQWRVLLLNQHNARTEVTWHSISKENKCPSVFHH